MSYYRDSIHNNTVLIPELVFDSCIPGYLMNKYGLTNDQARVKSSEMIHEFIARADYHYYHDSDSFKDKLNSVGEYRRKEPRVILSEYFKHWCDSWMKRPFRNSYLNIPKNSVVSLVD